MTNFILDVLSGWVGFTLYVLLWAGCISQAIFALERRNLKQHPYLAKQACIGWCVAAFFVMIMVVTHRDRMNNLSYSSVTAKLEICERDKHHSMQSLFKMVNQVDSRINEMQCKVVDDE